MLVEFGATAEELFFEMYGYEMSAVVELTVAFDMQPGDKGSRDYPGHPPTAEYLGRVIKSVDMYCNGQQVAYVAMLYATPVCEALKTWISENEESLTESAFEAAENQTETWG